MTLPLDPRNIQSVNHVPPNQEASIQKLPIDLLRKILQTINFRSEVSRVCKTWWKTIRTLEIDQSISNPKAIQAFAKLLLTQNPIFTQSRLNFFSQSVANKDHKDIQKIVSTMAVEWKKLDKTVVAKFSLAKQIYLSPSSPNSIKLLLATLSNPGNPLDGFSPPETASSEKPGTFTPSINFSQLQPCPPDILEKAQVSSKNTFEKDEIVVLQLKSNEVISKEVFVYGKISEVTPTGYFVQIANATKQFASPIMLGKLISDGP